LTTAAGGRYGSSMLAAAVQLNSTSDEEANWRSARSLIERAASFGARFVATPENTNFLGPHEDKVRRAEPLDGRTCERFASLAERLGVHLLLGSFNERSDEPARCYNTSVLFGPDGRQLAVYRKIHLFDVDAPGLRFFESATCKPGATPTVVTTPFGVLGLSICFDIRFPALYQRLTALGATILMVPSAFTLTTGKDHWETLLRARAIECQTYLVAPAQCGKHDDSGLRESWGHAMVIDPWGQVVGAASDGPGLAIADIDVERVAQIRRSMPLREPELASTARCRTERPTAEI
jgi:predicted amidohydrolase